MVKSVIKLFGLLLYTQITVLGREWFEGATVRAGLSRDLTNNAECGSPVTKYQAIANNWIEFPCSPPAGVIARYISININKTASLSLCEVIVSPCDLSQGTKLVRFCKVTLLSVIEFCTREISKG